MHIHILGIAGTFMSGIALIAKSLGHKVTGIDANIYPPISLQLKQNNISFNQGYSVNNLAKNVDLFIIGNALSRGNECVEEILNKQYNYTSGAGWLSQILRDKYVLAVSGTHGKTTTSAMLAWILEYAGLNPSFLIAGKMKDFPTTARLTNSKFFVIEADEYDSAFFDKRSKFIHYHPNTLIINNLEFDHSDIFDNLADIQKQFHHLIRTMASNSVIIYHKNSPNIKQVLAKGLWTPTKIIATHKLHYNDSGSYFNINDNLILNWQFIGQHNMQNALSAIEAAKSVGVSIKVSVNALTKFNGVSRRLEIKYQDKNITLYDDFAHHPSAISSTLLALRNKLGNKHITAILELRTNTMKAGFYKQSLLKSLQKANISYILKPKSINPELEQLLTNNPKIKILASVDDIVSKCLKISNTNIVVMSNGNFDNINDKIILKLT